MTDVEIEYAKWLVEGVVQMEGREASVWVAHAWIEVNDAHLTTKIPSARILRRWKMGSEDVTLSDFSQRTDNLNGPTSLMMLSARDVGGGRKSYTTADDLKVWDDETLPFGYGKSKFLTNAQANVIRKAKGLVA
jgi:hypothetical protein